AYLQTGAPNYTRLSDGKQVQALAQIMEGAEGVTILIGRVISVTDDTMVLRVHERPNRDKTITGLSKEQHATFAAMIKPVKEPQQPAYVATREAENKLVAVDVVMEPVTPWALQRACRELKVLAIPDFRPVKVGVEPKF